MACGSTPKKASKIHLENPSDVSQCTSNCKAYIDAMREQHETIEDDYILNNLKGPNLKNIEINNKESSTNNNSNKGKNINSLNDNLKEQKENQIGISLRSRKIPVNKIAESFGGGGHLYAAGAVVADSLQNVHDKVISAFKGM